MITVTNQYFETVSASKGKDTIMEKSFDAKTSYWITRFKHAVSLQLQAYMDTKAKLATQYSQKDKDGKPIQDGDQILIEDISAFMKEMKTLLEIEVKIHLKPIEPDWEKFPDLSPGEMEFLAPLLSV